MGPRTLVSPGERHSWWACQTGSAACALRNPLLSLSPYLSYPLSSFLGLEAYCLFQIFWHTGSLNFHWGTCVTSSCLLCPLWSTLQWTQPSFRFLSLQDWQNREFFLQRLWTLVPGHLSSHSALSSYDFLRRSLFGDSLSLYDLWSRPWGVVRLLGLHGLPPCLHPSEGVG